MQLKFEIGPSDSHPSGGFPVSNFHPCALRVVPFFLDLACCLDLGSFTNAELDGKRTA